MMKRYKIIYNLIGAPASEEKALFVETSITDLDYLEYKIRKILHAEYVQLNIFICEYKIPEFKVIE
jgi:hypothetical protein